MLFKKYQTAMLLGLLVAQLIAPSSVFAQQQEPSTAAPEVVLPHQQETQSTLLDAVSELQRQDWKFYAKPNSDELRPAEVIAQLAFVKNYYAVSPVIEALKKRVGLHLSIEGNLANGAKMVVKAFDESFERLLAAPMSIAMSVGGELDHYKNLAKLKRAINSISHQVAGSEELEAIAAVTAAQSVAKSDPVRKAIGVVLYGLSAVVYVVAILGFTLGVFGLTAAGSRNPHLGAGFLLGAAAAAIGTGLFLAAKHVYPHKE